MFGQRRLVALVAVIVALVAACGEEFSPGDQSSTTVLTTPPTQSTTTTVPPTTEAEELVDGATGIIVYTEGRRYSFWADTNGSVRFVDQIDGTMSGYDAATLTSWVVVGETAQGKNLGHPPSGPDSKEVGPIREPWLWVQALGRSRAGAGDEFSWTARERGDPELGEPAEVECTYSVRLDPESRLLLAAIIQCGDRPAVGFEVVDFDSAARIAPAIFAAPTDVDNVVSDQGFRYVTLDEAKTLVGYPLPVPRLPAGYALATVVHSPHAADSPVEIIHDMPSYDVVVMVFRDGYQTVTVTTRAHVATLDLGGGRTAPVEWRDPWAGDFASPASTRQGAIDGLPATFRVHGGTGRAWAVTDQVVITVEGALSAAELEALIASFRTD